MHQQTPEQVSGVCEYRAFFTRAQGVTCAVCQNLTWSRVDYALVNKAVQHADIGSPQCGSACADTADVTAGTAHLEYNGLPR